MAKNRHHRLTAMDVIARNDISDGVIVTYAVSRVLQQKDRHPYESYVLHFNNMEDSERCTVLSKTIDEARKAHASLVLLHGGGFNEA